MGTRADFYIGAVRGDWLGSIAWDGYPSGIPDAIKLAATEDDYNDATLAEMGWPWPWNDSATTDWAYAWTGTVMASCFGRSWIFVPREGDGPDEWPEGPAPIFPDMSARKRVTFGPRSGVILIRSRGVGQEPEVIA